MLSDVTALLDDRYPSLDEMLAEITDLRPMPAVRTRVLELTDDDNFSAHDLSQALSSDQALTEKLLRLANSAYYNYPRSISTVRDAVVLLGFRAVRSATLASCVIGTMEGTHELDPEEFWRFSIIVGACAEILAREQNSYPPDEAFAGGLLHTVGVLALDQHRPDMLRDTLHRATSSGVPRHDVQLAMLGFTDAQLGGALTLNWNSPEPLVAAVEGYSLGDPNLPGIPDLTAHVVSARAFVLSLGISGGLGPVEPSPPPATWMRPGVAAALARSGGVEGVIESANAFVEATVA
jgi:HD-like signal output (HDOD) protein